MPGLRLGALVTETGLLTGVADYWTGGLDVRARPFRGDHAAAAASLGATASTRQILMPFRSPKGCVHLRHVGFTCHAAKGR